MLKAFLNLLRMESIEISNDVIFETKNKCGIITLNKPKALNAVNSKMFKAIMEHLKSWEDTRSMVIIRAEGRAFCAGGDVKDFAAGGPKNMAHGKDCFLAEYTVDYKIPYIALIDGITMGGGVGLSVHGRYRVATERTMLAMPENAIGLFTDIGASYFLSRLPGHLGVFLALTGYRLIGSDVLKTGIATHYCDSKDIKELSDALLENQGDDKAIQQTLNKFSKSTLNVPFSLEDKCELINKIFSLPTVEAIFSALAKDNSAWSKDILGTLQKLSPTSLKITHRALLLGKSLSLHECLQMDYRLVTSFLEARITNDFYEGVRAVMVDKDKNPKWNPANLEDITDDMIESCFGPLSLEEESIIKQIFCRK